jgi:hypothetical protein
LAYCTYSEKGEKLPNCAKDDSFRADYLSYLYSNIFVHPFFALFPKPMTMPTQVIGLVFQGNAINDSLWTIPHQIFCYAMIFFVDILSFGNNTVKLEVLIFLYTSFYVLGAIQFIGYSPLDNDILIPKSNNGWYGHEGRCAMYSDFLYGALLYNVVVKSSIMLSTKCLSLNFLVSFMPLVVIPWALNNIDFFAILYSPILPLFALAISQALLTKKKKNMIFMHINKPILKSCNTIYFFGAPIQKVLYYYCDIQSVFMIFILTTIICIVIHNIGRMFDVIVSGRMFNNQNSTKKND